MTLEEELAELRKRTKRVGFMPVSTQEPTQRALDGSGQRPPLPEGRIPSASVMDEPAGFQGLKTMDPTRLARRGASYLWSGDKGVQAFDEAEYKRTGNVTRDMDRSQYAADMRNLQTVSPLAPVVSQRSEGPVSDQPAPGPVSATVDQVLAQQGSGQPQQAGFQYDYEDALSRMGDTSAGGGRIVAPEAQRGVFVKGYRFGGPTGVGSSEEARAMAEAGIAPDVDPLVAAQGERGIRPGGFAERTTPDGGAYVIGSEADPMRRLEMQREAYRAANRERYQDLAAGMRTEGAKPQLTAAQMGDKRELDKRKALIETMAEGPDKQDALAALQDEETAKRQAGVKDSDRFTGSIGSPDWKERQGRMEAYKQKLTELSNNRLITKQQAGAAMAQARKADVEEAKAMETMRTIEQKQEDKQVEAELMQRGLTEKKSIAAANSGFRSMATFNGKIGGKGPRINGAQVTDMFMQMDPAMRMDVMEEAARNVEHYEMDPRAAFMAAFTPFLKMKQRQTS